MAQMSALEPALTLIRLAKRHQIAHLMNGLNKIMRAAQVKAA
jgi:hypothetical protein